MPYGIYDGGAVIAQFVAPMTVRSNHPIYASDTLSLSRRTTQRTVQRWEIETRLEPLSSSAQKLFVHLINKGYSTSFTISTPQNYGAILARTHNGSPTVYSTTGAAGTSSVQLTAGAITGTMPAGTFIKFANHNKVYLTTTDWVAAAGNPVVSIYPPLKVTAPSTTVVTCRDDVLMTCFYDLDVLIGMSYIDGILMDVGTIKLVEAI